MERVSGEANDDHGPELGVPGRTSVPPAESANSAAQSLHSFDHCHREPQVSQLFCGDNSFLKEN